MIAAGKKISSQSSLGLNHLREGTGDFDTESVEFDPPDAGAEVVECDPPDRGADMLNIYHITWLF
jgi:hypothetical protein